MRDDRDVERFERWAPRYDRSPMQRIMFRPLHRFILESLRMSRGDRFLDVGCGTGNLVLLAAGRGHRVVGVDPAKRMVEVARGKAFPASARPAFLVGAAEALPLRDRSFDAAATSVSLHHWRDRGAGLAEMRRVLRPGGRVVIAELGFLGPLGRLLPAFGHPRVPSTRELARLLVDAGFVGVRRLGKGLRARMVAVVGAEAPAEG